MRFRRDFFCYVLFFSLISIAYAAFASEREINSAVQAINDGFLRQAKSILDKIVKNPSGTTLERAVAYKHLGTVLFRMGNDYRPAFDESANLFETELESNPSSEAKKQYGFMLYQKANCLLSDCENKLAQAKLQVIQVIPFQYIKDYLHPAAESLRKAKDFYPKKQLGDILLLEVDLIHSEFHIWYACHQIDSAQRACERAITAANNALTQKTILPDVRKKLLLHKAQLLMEVSSKKSPKQNLIRSLLKDALDIKSGNAELDLSVFAFYAKFILDSGSVDYKKLENELHNALDQIEQLRTTNLKDMDFTAKKNYFSTRTGLYEILMMLYAKQNRPFDMLLSINQVRSRAIQDEIGINKISTQKQLQEILKENQGMLVAYFVGCDHIWTIQFTSDSANIFHSKHDGQELTKMCWAVIKTYTNSKFVNSCIQAFFRYPTSPREQVIRIFQELYFDVPRGFDMSHILYEELFKASHLLFSKKRLKHLYIIPHNILNYLPFSALVVKTDKNNIFNSRYVADDAIPITYLPSVNGLSEHIVQTKKERSLILARNDYSYPAQYHDNSKDPDDPNAPLIQLENAIEEGESIAKILKTSENHFLKEKEASEYNLIRVSSACCSVVHIASHAHLFSANPLESYVVLAAGHGEDGKVKVRELLSRYKGKIKTNLLVLSACNSNRGEDNLLPGDDIAALSNAFLVAGVKNVIATQWNADDSAFKDIMKQFYQNLSSGLANDEAMARALKKFFSQKLHLRYPIFWGNIVLTGGLQ